MVELSLETMLGEDSAQTLKEIGGLKDDASNLEERIKSVESDGRAVNCEYKNGEIVVTVKDN